MPAKIIYKEGDMVGDCFFVKLLPTINYVRKALFKCKCGTEFPAAISAVRFFHTRSCGCISAAINLSGDRRRTHGESQSGGAGTKENLAYTCMKARCYNENYEHYDRYGGRGIKVCQRWLDSYENFLLDMGRAPSSRHTLERKNNDGDYGPDNCVWATKKEQANNRSSTRIYDFNGDTLSIKQFSEKYNVGYHKLYHRVNKDGSIKSALEKLKAI